MLRNNVSAYLLLPLRTLAQALLDREAKKSFLKPLDFAARV